MINTGFYLPQYNWSVELYKSEWITRARLPGDKMATTPQALRAIAEWATFNRRKFYGPDHD